MSGATVSVAGHTLLRAHKLGWSLRFSGVVLLSLVVHVRHLEMVLERGQRLLSPVLQLRVISAPGIALEERDCLL